MIDKEKWVLAVQLLQKRPARFLLPCDAFIFGIRNPLGKDYAQIRRDVDGFCLLAGIFTGGFWGMHVLATPHNGAKTGGFAGKSQNWS